MSRKRPTPPKYLTECYDITPRDWMRWLRFRKRVIDLSKQGFDAMDDYFNKCRKGCRRITVSTRFGMHSTTSSDRLEMFEWADFTRRDHDCLGTSISVIEERRDSYTRTIAEASYG